MTDANKHSHENNGWQSYEDERDEASGDGFAVAFDRTDGRHWPWRAMAMGESVAMSRLAERRRNCIWQADTDARMKGGSVRHAGGSRVTITRVGAV